MPGFLFPAFFILKHRYVGESKASSFISTILRHYSRLENGIGNLLPQTFFFLTQTKIIIACCILKQNAIILLLSELEAASFYESYI